MTTPTPVLNDQDFGSVARILNLQAPATDNEPARLADLNQALEGLASKDNVRVATVGNISLSAPGASLDGVTLAAGDRVLVKDQTAAAENGIYLFDTDATAMIRSADASTADELESAITFVDEGTHAGTTWRQTAVNFTLDTDAIAWIAFGTVTPDAATNAKGVVELATQTEVDGGTDSIRVVTPQTLRNYVWLLVRKGGPVGNGVATEFTLNHGLNNYGVHVEVFENSGLRRTVDCSVERPDVNNVRVKFNTPPTTDQYFVSILG